MRAKLAVLVQPPGRGDRIAAALGAHGYRVAVHRDLGSARRHLRKVQAVEVLFVDQGEPWFAGNDLLSALEEFPSLRHTQVVVTVTNPASVFVAALRASGAAVLFHPVAWAHVQAIARGEAVTETPDVAGPGWTRRPVLDSARLREQAHLACARTRKLMAESRRLADGVEKRRRRA